MSPTERELLNECERLAAETGHALRDLITDAESYWRGPGRAVEPRRWRSRADACRRLLAGGGPGYPGPCPRGMDWSAWLAMNNVD